MIYVLPDYDFIKPLVMPFDPTKEQVFFNDGLCFADDPKEPNTIYVFHFEEIEGKAFIFATYGVVKKFNKKFLKFHKEVEKMILSLNLPVFRIGTKKVFKNHTKLFNVVDGIEVYQYTKFLTNE